MIWGWLVVVAALVVVGLPVVWWALRTDDRLPEEEGGYGPSEATQVIRVKPENILPAIRVESRPTPETALIIDVRPIMGGPTIAIDELGEWDPTEHELDQPLILGHVIASRAWGALSLSEMGLVAA